MIDNIEILEIGFGERYNPMLADRDDAFIVKAEYTDGIPLTKDEVYELNNTREGNDLMWEYIDGKVENFIATNMKVS